MPFLFFFISQASVTEKARVVEEYQAKCAELEEALLGTRKMVNKPRNL